MPLTSFLRIPERRQKSNQRSVEFPVRADSDVPGKSADLEKNVVRRGIFSAFLGYLSEFSSIAGLFYEITFQGK